ncbi:MAG: helix-turn-helix domain-containing protein [Desulfovibrio sp.]|jgi:transcriptional regulator with XRE-family HTH domain|nr:helix-turn-helix domain-containing protein [Desulfovibrio sp.]
MSDSLKRLGRRVRHFRTEKGLSQEKVAELSGISSKYMSDLERGEANVSVQVLERVAVNVGASAIDLLDNEHEAERKLLVQEIVSFLETTSDDKVKTVYRIMKGVL